MVTQFKQQDALPEFKSIQNQAIAKHKAGEIEAAIVLYLESLQLEADQPDWIYGNIITLLVQADRLEEALSLQEKALAKYSDSDEIYRALGLAFNRQGDFAKSIDCYSNSLKIQPQQPDWVYSSLVEMLVATNQLTQAIAIGQEGLEFQNESPWLNYHLAEAFAGVENWLEAISYYSQAAKIQPDLPRIQDKINLANENIKKAEETLAKKTSLEEKLPEVSAQAIAKHQAGETEAAIVLYLESLQLQENQPDWIYGNIITLLVQANRLEEALSLQEKALAKHADSDEIHRALGLAFNRQGDFAKSIDCYLTSLKIQPQQPDWVYSSLVEMLVATNQLTQAIAIGEAGLEFHGESAWLNYHLAAAFSGVDNWYEAISYYSQAAQLQPDLPNIQNKINLANENIKKANEKSLEEELHNLYQQAIAKHQAGEIEAAIVLYLESLQLEENQPDWVYSNIITLLVQIDRLEEALSLQEKALAKYPNSDEIYRALGLAFNRKDDWDKSIDYYLSSIKINPAQPDWIYSSLVEMLASKHQLSQAITIGQAGLEFHSESAWLNYHLAAAFSGVENWAEAISYFTKAAQIQPDLPGIQDKINLATENSKKVDETPSEDLADNIANNFQAQAVAKHKEGETEAAITLYLKSVELEEAQPDWVYGNLITLLGQVSNFDLAIEIGLKAEKIYPQSDEIYRARALVSAQIKDTENTIKLYQKAFELNPRQPDWCYFNFARELLQNEGLKKAIEVAKQGLKYYPDYYYLNYVQAQAFAEQQRWDEAITAYIYVQEQNPDWLEVEEKLTQAVYQKNKQERADAPLYSNQVLEKGPSFWLNSKATDPVAPKINKQPKLRIEKLNDLDINSLFRQIQNSIRSLDEFQKRCDETKTKYILDLNYGYWLNTSMLYLEASIDDNFSIKEDVDILVTDGNEYLITRAKFFHLSPDQIIGIACFAKDSYAKLNQHCRIYLNNENQLVTTQNFTTKKAFNLEIIEHFRTKTEKQKHLVREKISNFLIRIANSHIQEDVNNLLNKLQYFLDIRTENIIDFNIPFKIAIDNIIYPDHKNLFMSGWLKDDYEMLKSIRVISSLGFAWDLPKQDILTLERQDNHNFLTNTDDDFQGSLGFALRAQIPQDIGEAMKKWPEIHSFRFLVKLKGDIEVEIVPEAKQKDLAMAMAKVIQIAEPNKISTEMLEQHIAPTAFQLQQLLMAQVKIKDITVIGELIETPLVSIIIPLYRRLDFLKVQLAAIANDPTMKQCELIYVLDSPEQESEVRGFLQDHCLLYDLSVTLIIMETNSGYASANNAGASQARGKYLLLLNSDVFPKNDGWALQMANFYDSSPKIGILGAKLLYEDNSLQHAGLFFEETGFPFPNVLHYYKGLPENYELAQKTRAVPAVSGACLMIEKDLYEQVSGLTTDYIIGYFDDSDLCLKCAALGYESWYFADASLYHLERQSIHLHKGYNCSLAWYLNGYLHDLKWGEQIGKLINDAQ
ncbi:putative glycosyltransferase [Xenococcus sp. PCC 7305]|uniref:tetratricopeptide repeat protein n=1 Tax=Xenococcus sp. PCC 7305 TaxID=102125 RepID=UPI0002AC2D50|nr:tetratricopeptide repeat protein [Xenococcus sp. PCC 7305]ELS03711.1 putative glycosyltransferase [Xenococcus sp. PCC 7305]